MSVVKVIEVSAESNVSFEEAILHGIGIASKTVNNIKSAWVKEQKVMVENDKISQFRVVLKVSFILE